MATLSANACRLAIAGLLLTPVLSGSGAYAQERAGVTPDRDGMYRHLKLAREIARDDLYPHYVHRCVIDQSYRRTISRGVQAHNALPATRVLDELYFVGENAVSAWVLDTGDGLVLFDALYAPGDMGKILEPGMRKLGLDPAKIRYLIITHSHGDHFGGARYLKERYGTRIMASPADWAEMAKQAANPRPDMPAEWAKNVPDHDIDIADGQVFTLGKVKLTFFLTPGHTPGTISTVFAAHDKGVPHTVGFFGGLGTPDTAEGKRQIIASLEAFKPVVRKYGIDVQITNHPTQDQSIPKLEELNLRRASDPNPYVIGSDRYIRYLSLQQECTRFAAAQQGQGELGK
jgi:metallo-beta-lactamase class B